MSKILQELLTLAMMTGAASAQEAISLDQRADSRFRAAARVGGAVPVERSSCIKVVTVLVADAGLKISPSAGSHELKGLPERKSRSRLRNGFAYRFYYAVLRSWDLPQVVSSTLYAAIGRCNPLSVSSPTGSVVAFPSSAARTFAIDQNLAVARLRAKSGRKIDHGPRSRCTRSGPSKPIGPSVAYPYAMPTPKTELVPFAPPLVR